MADQTNSTILHPATDVLTRGFDPKLSVGSARPAVFRSSTYVFSSPEEAEKAFDVMAGRAELAPGENVDLVYSRFNLPNAEILEQQIIPLEPGAQAAAVFNSGMAAIMTTVLAVVRPGNSIIFTVPIYGATQTFIADFLKSFGVEGIPVRAGRTAEIIESIGAAKNLRVVLIETPANPTIVMTDIKSARNPSTPAQRALCPSSCCTCSRRSRRWSGKLSGSASVPGYATQRPRRRALGQPIASSTCAKHVISVHPKPRSDTGRNRPRTQWSLPRLARGFVLKHQRSETSHTMWTDPFRLERDAGPSPTCTSGRYPSRPASSATIPGTMADVARDHDPQRLFEISILGRT
jgi:hypothetical protein